MIEILTPATNARLTTVQAVKEGVPALAGSAFDPAISALIDQFSDTITAWCNRPFSAMTVRETMSVTRRDDRRALWLIGYPIISIDSLTINGAAISDSAYVINRSDGELIMLQAPTRVEPWPVGDTVVTYQAGYVMPGEANRTLPHDVERACIVAVRNAMAQMLRDPALRSEEVDGVATFTYFATHGDALTAEAQALLSRYRKPALA